MGMLDALKGLVRGGGNSDPSRPVAKSNAQTILDAVVGSEFEWGKPYSNPRPTFTVDIMHLRGRPHLNVRTKVASGIEDLRNTELVVIDRRTLKPVGKMKLGLQGSVVFADMELLHGVEEVTEGTPLRISLP